MIQRTLEFLRIIDEKANLSITNLSVITVLGKIFSSGAISNADLMALAAVLANYAIKKAIVYFEQRTPQPTTIDVAALQASVTALQDELSDAKAKISGLSLAAGLRPIPPRNQ